MDKQELIKRYSLLAKEFNLSSWEKIDKEFFLSFSIPAWRDIPDQTLLFIMNRIMDYMNSWINFCHTLINGNPQSMILMKETEFFSAEKKKEIINVMQDLTILSRKQNLMNLINDEVKIAQFLKEIDEDWKSIKQKLLEYATKSYACWLEEKRNE